MAKQWRCAVVGTGTVGSWHVGLTSKMPNTKLVACCDIVAGRAQAVLDKAGVKGVATYTDEAEMLAREQIDIVHICTPSGNHKDPTLLAIEAGCNVITEKPMEIQLDRIDAMAAAGARKKVRLAGVFQNRWDGANKSIKAAMQAGRFGMVSMGSITCPWYRTDQYYADGGWRGTWALDGGGAIMNQGVHNVDLIQWIMGPVRQVSAYGGSRIHPAIEVEDTLTCALQFESGAYGFIMGSTAMYPGGSVRLEVGGSNGSAVAEAGLRTWKFRETSAEDEQIRAKYDPSYAKTTGGGTSPTDVNQDLHWQNLQHILESWEAGRDAETHPPEARKAVAIILAMYESMRKDGQPVRVR
ncbi:MAG TPA: Gfo/Idh/MocA family oxidoreductase [Tepidisphaeraceae bacterium]|jgi:predicted dehydrogenase